jgi:transposase
LDGFWIHRVLQSEGIESHVVDAASIPTSRRRRRAKTDRIDGETLVRNLTALKRGEPRVCSMARAPTGGQEEDRRRVYRERRTLVGERVKHFNMHVSGHSRDRYLGGDPSVVDWILKTAAHDPFSDVSERREVIAAFRRA